MTLVLIENKKQTMNLTEDDLSFLSSGPIESQFKIRRLAGSLGYEITPLNIVGALTLPSGQSIVIKPKLPLPNIFRMLSYVGELYKPLDHDVYYENDEDLFDILGKIFAQEMGRILRAGLRQNYSQHNESLSTLRGRIDFTQSLTILHSNHISCRYSKLSLNTPLNRAIVKAAEVLLLSNSIKGDTKRQVRSCLSHIPLDVVGRNFTFSEFKNISLDRSTQYYQRIIYLSRLIIANASYRDDAGENRFAGFLLDVSRLFEKYVARALETENGRWDFRVISQNSTKLDVEQELTCRPDLTFVGQNGICYVADTKYKDFSDLRFINEDVYQMITYLLHHRCTEGFLIYPVFDPQKVGIVKTIHIPNGQGTFIIHGVCLSLESPKNVIDLLKEVMYSSDLSKVL